jgi:membrane protein
MSEAAPSGLALNPMALTRAGGGVIRRALRRLWGRDVMLYTGGVSFYAMLAGFPAAAILVSVYSLMFTPEQAARHARGLALFLPDSAQSLFSDELQRLAHTPLSTVGAQGGLAVLVSLYAAHRGVKALIAGLSFIHAHHDSRSFVRINLMALLVFLAGLALILVASTAFLIVRILVIAFDPEVSRKGLWLFSQWAWACVGLTLGLTLIYRYVMAGKPIGWRSAGIGGVTAAGVSLVASWACAFYVDRVARLGATYGSIAAVVVCLIWISWNVNAVFFGGALATETELLMDEAPFRPSTPVPG